MLVVLMGLAVVAAAVVPSIAAAGRGRDLDRVAARVAASARFAREVASDEQAALTLTVEPTLNLVRLAWEEEPEADMPMRRKGEDRTDRAPLPRALALVRLPESVSARIEAAEADGVSRTPLGTRAVPTGDGLRFPADGRARGGVIVLTDERGRERRVVVAPRTGVVHIESGDG